MVREQYRTKTPFSRKLLGFLLLNIIPIGGLAWFVWGLSSDTISLDDLPEGLDRNAAYLGVAIAVLFVVVTFVIPFAHFFASRLRASLLRSRSLRSEGGFLRLVWECLLWPFRQLAHVVFWVVRFAGYLVALG
ncbi:MAG: hypothetical protein KDB53_21890, partial [Planctomycetes bacterium]|nr:hypothetical protein [Planctomycetota bacterium]